MCSFIERVMHMKLIHSVVPGCLEYFDVLTTTILAVIQKLYRVRMKVKSSYLAPVKSTCRLRLVLTSETLTVVPLT